VIRHGIYASKFPAGAMTVWTFVNRNEFDVAGSQIQVSHQKDSRYFDLWNGEELKPDLHDGRAVLSFPMEAHGYGAVLATASSVPGLESFLSEMEALARTRWRAIRPTGECSRSNS